jgi:hypothetical protein
VKDAFQGYFFNAHQNVAGRLKKGILVCELTSWQELLNMAKEVEIRGCQIG